MLNPREEFKMVLFFVSMFVYLVNILFFFIIDKTYKRFKDFKYYLIPLNTAMLVLHIAYYLA